MTASGPDTPRGTRPPLFTGVGVALATFFDRSGAVDEAATADHAARLVDLGVRAVVAAGSTGEAAALTEEERDGLLAAVLTAVRATGPGVPVLAGTGAAWPGLAARQTERARAGGADAVLTLSPPRVADPTPYYRSVAEAAGDLPVLGYHFPAVCPPGIPLETLPGLPVAGCKDSSGDADRLLRTRASFDGWLYVGSAVLCSMAGPLGCTGAILAVANAEPELAAAAFAGDADAQQRLLPAHVETGRQWPHGLKALTAHRFGTPTGARMG